MNHFIQIIQEYSRKKEDKINQQILDADPKKSTSIANLIDKTLNTGHKVYLMSDWHLIKFDKDTKANYQNPKTNTIIKNCQSIINHDDLLIFLGDICDGEIEKKQEISSILQQIPGIKIMTRGNNDLFDDQWYLDNGFRYVTPKFIWNDILFSHRPQDNQNKLNIHGHIHGSHKYYASEISHFHNQIDVAYFGGREKPLELNWLIDQFPKYKRTAVFIDKPWKNDPRVDGKPS